jgi:site-specific DNA recombinase
MRLVLAARLSQLTKGQTGLDTQDEDARAWAAAHGHTIVAATPDRISGRVSPFKRPQLGPWLTEPERMAMYDGILVSKIDRLTRKADWDIRQWAEEHGKKILVVSPELEWPPPSGEAGTATRMIWDSLMNLAQGEWENTSTRYLRMQRALREQAFFVGKPPYGYRIVQVDGTEHKTLEPDPVTGAIARGMAKRYLEGQSLQQICEWLISQAIPVPQQPKNRAGRGWTAQAVRATLRNPAMIGRIQVKGRTYLRVEALISADDHKRILELMASRPSFRGKRAGTTALLTGLLFCPEGHPMYRIQGRIIPTVPDGQYYYCRECPKGDRLLVPLAATDQAVNDLIMDHEHEPHFVIEFVAGAYDYQDEIDQTLKDIRELDPETSEYDAKLVELRAELSRLRALQKKAREEPPKFNKKPDGKTIGEFWKPLDTAGKRQYLRELGDKYCPFKGSEGHVGVIPLNSLEGKDLYDRIELLGGPPWRDIFKTYAENAEEAEEAANP